MDFSFLEKRFSSPWFVFILIGFSVVIIYSNIYKSPFIFDDVSRIVENKNLKNLSYYLSPSELLKPRAVVDLTFALNYKFGKLNVFGYHLVNVLVHILNGFLTYFLIFAILQQRPEILTPANHLTSESKSFSIESISLFSAMIFVVHPIQTQAVTYTVQRYASMGAMFFMGSMLFYVYARTNQVRAKSRKQGKTKNNGGTNTFKLSSLYTLSIACGMLAFLSKENTASLPGAILLTEYLIINGTWHDWKKKLPWFALAFTCWLFFVLFVSGLFSGEFGDRNLLEDVSALTKETVTVSRWSYLCTQFNVLVIYIRLLFLPINQNLDYLYSFKTGFFDGITPYAFIVLIAIAGFGIWIKKRHPVITFSIFFFFITLSIESSIIPIRDALLEHRLYLPMLGFGLFVSYQLFHYLYNKRSLALVLSLSIIASLGSATYLRNITWQDKTNFWSDVVSKSPHNYRAHNNLGSALDQQGRTKEAIEHYLMALRITPNFEEAHYNLGIALDKQGRREEAIGHYLQALRIKPDYVGAHNNLGIALAEQGHTEEAIEHYLQALRIKPDYAEGYNNLGLALNNQGRTEEAIEHFLQALRIKPDYVDAHNNLGNALGKQGRTTEAIEHYLQALRIKPDFAEVHNNLAVALFRTGNIKGAIAHFREVLRIDPDHVYAKNNLKKVLMLQQQNE